MGVACDGTHLFVADRVNHRVLVWDQFPTSNGQPASRVLGQPSFTSVGAHGGAGPFTITANGFNLPTGLALDGTSLWVADTENNRVVRWDNVFSSAAPGAFLGQPNGTSISNPNYQFGEGPFQGYSISPAPSTSATSVLRPRGVYIAGGKIFVSETDSNRVHVFDRASLAPIAIVGQADDVTATSDSGGVSAHSLSEAVGLGSDGTNLWVVDARNSRMLGFPLAGLASGASATAVVGQSSLGSGGFNGVTAAVGGAVGQPGGLRLTVAGELAVADTANHRVLIFDTTASPAALKSVIGQADDKGNSPNGGGSVGPSGLNAPRGVWADDKHLLVADTANNRALVFDRTAPSAALVALGQPTLTSSSANAGGATAATMSSPWDVCSDGARVAVVDTGNSRVLVWSTLPSQSGQPADVILGQVSVSTLMGPPAGKIASH